jgi:hypothetical protein
MYESRLIPHYTSFLFGIVISIIVIIIMIMINTLDTPVYSNTSVLLTGSTLTSFDRRHDDRKLKSRERERKRMKRGWQVGAGRVGMCVSI